MIYIWHSRSHDSSITATLHRRLAVHHRSVHATNLFLLAFFQPTAFYCVDKRTRGPAASRYFRRRPGPPTIFFSPSTTLGTIGKLSCAAMWSVRSPGWGENFPQSSDLIFDDKRDPS